MFGMPLTPKRFQIFALTWTQTKNSVFGQGFRGVWGNRGATVPTHRLPLTLGVDPDWTWRKMVSLLAGAVWVAMRHEAGGFGRTGESPIWEHFLKASSDASY